MSNASSTTVSPAGNASARACSLTSDSTSRICGRRRRSSVAKCRPIPLAAPVMIATWSFMLGLPPGSGALDDPLEAACEWLEEPWRDAVQQVERRNLALRHRDDELVPGNGLQHRLRDLVRGCPALGVEARGPPLDRRQVAAHDPGRDDLGVDDAGTDRADVDAALGELGVERLAEADDPELRRAVRGHLGHRHQARHRCGVHDRRRAALLQHPRDERLDAVGDAEQVHPDDALPILDGGRLDVPAMTDTGVVVKDVHVADLKADTAKDVAGAIEAAGGSAAAHALDVSDPDAVE